LRAIISSESLGEKTIYVDCDVLQADGGTRTACITGSYLALKAAQNLWLTTGLLKKPFLLDEIASISAGFVNGIQLLDLNYQEDSNAQMDFNFVLTRSGKIVELQGSAEKMPISWNEFESIRGLAQKGITEIFSFYDAQFPDTSAFAKASAVAKAMPDRRGEWIK
jgi:ribonuclease PH